ncbi:glycosyltransferase family 49 protein [Lichtheimia corymbifera JMRC:FSU:9682]|uniref:Glycosyltransferase family 49 protein n=1 Tax=Lichtheimia corymbifera JMRC:FSU:9682 TaxID=1263082 RepID=A0A068S4V3_9FUNG|nr:glycosyltransferase family 49 protein [Lichtheimia corymbifera JMRC:FSU:9682]
MRLELSQTAAKVFKYLLISYAVVSIVYTVSYLYTNYEGTHHDVGIIVPRAPNPQQRQQESLIVRPPPPVEQSFGDHTVIWSNTQDSAQAMSEQLLMAKVFSDALGPTVLTPYFFRAKATFDKEDISISTLVSRNRFSVLSRLATNHKGPISAAVHINDNDEKEHVLQELRELWMTNPDMQQYVDIHLIVDIYDRQFNMWRNVAKLFARTDYIMMLDVDFHLCTDIRKSIRSNPEWMNRLRQGRTALVVPAFEFNLQEDGEDWRTFPNNKNDLKDAVNKDKIDMFHKAWIKGHGSTNYSHWYESDDLYKVTQYDFSYEPYIIYKKEGSPWCPERFIGYGANKAACLYEIYLSGIEYWVLPNDFLIHQTHRYPEDARRKERQYNRKLYMNFREEVCMRYARKFYMTGEWDTPRADNLKQECDKIHGFQRTIKSTTL